MRRLAPALVVALAVLPFSAHAQSAAPDSGAQSIDPSKLGISVERIQRELSERQFDSGPAGNGLRLNYRIEVFGQAPQIDVLGDFDVLHGPVPRSGPTHQEFLDQVTPQEYRAPAASLSNVFFWAAQKLSERNAKQRCEAELAEYRARVMAGMNASPPSCAR